MSPTPAILLLAAGASSRMRGRDKLLEPLRGLPLVAERAQTARATGLPVIAVLPPRAQAPGRWAALEGHDLICVAVAAPDPGLSASLRAGLAVLPPGCTGVLVMLADMPEIASEDLALLLADWDGQAIRRAAGADGTPGNPVLFPARDLAALAALTGDTGARALLERAAGRVSLVPLPARHALTDLDTPEDWAAWRAAQTDPNP